MCRSKLPELNGQTGPSISYHGYFWRFFRIILQTVASCYFVVNIVGDILPQPSSLLGDDVFGVGNLRRYAYFFAETQRAARC